MKQYYQNVCLDCLSDKVKVHNGCLNATESVGAEGTDDDANAAGQCAHNSMIASGATE